MDSSITIKEELDICDYEIDSQEANSSLNEERQRDQSDYKIEGVQSEEPFGIFNEDRDMITVNVGSLQSEEERNFIENIDLDKIFTETIVSNVCVFCQKSFNNVLAFLEHKKQSICQFFWQQPYSCNLCALVFESQHKLVKHYRLHQRNMHFCRTGCGKFFRKVECCLEHEFRDHSGKERKFKCRFCNLTLTSSNQLIQHVSSIHAYVYRYVCSICRTNFESGEELKNHWSLNRSTCGLIKFDDHSHTNGELVGIKAIARKPEVEQIKIQVKTENDAWNSELVRIKVEPTLQDEDEVKTPTSTLNHLENVKLEIKEEETDDETETEFETSNGLDLPSIQYSKPTLDISKLRLPSLTRGEAGKATLLTTTHQKKAAGTAINQPCLRLFRKGERETPNVKASNSNLKGQTASTLYLTEISENVENSITYFKVVPLKTIKQPSASNCNTSDEINENANFTRTEGEVNIKKCNNNNLKAYNVLNLPSNAKIIRLHNLKATTTAENANNSAFKSDLSSQSMPSEISSIPKNIIVKNPPGQHIPAQPTSPPPINQILDPYMRRNFCFTNDTMSYFEALPESRKVIEEFKNQIKSIEQNLSEFEPESNCRPNKECKILPKPQQKKQPETETEHAFKGSVPTTLVLPLDEDSEIRLMGVRCDYPDYRFSLLCPKCPRQYELKHAFHAHLKGAHGIMEDDIKQLLVKVRPQQKEEKNNLKKGEPEVLELPLNSESDKKLMQVRWAHPNYRFTWTCPNCPRQYELKYAFRSHLTRAHGFSNHESENMMFSIRPFKLLSPMKAKQCSKEQRVESIVAASEAVVCDKEPTAQAMPKDVTNNEPTMKKVSRLKLYECSVCLKRFSASGTLNCHMSIHTGELPHKCDYCDKRFRTRGQVTVHHRTHTGERPFTCQVCSLGFTHRETLISHLSRHIGMKRYKCYGCDKTFSCISGLRTHRDVRPNTCGMVKFSPRAIGPRVRVVRGNVIFEQQPKDNPYLRSDEPPEMNEIDEEDQDNDASQ